MRQDIIRDRSCRVPRHVRPHPPPLSAGSSASTGATKFAVEFTPERGTIPFDERAASARCVGRHAPLRIEAADDATVERMQSVVIEHLNRFAFREDLGQRAVDQGGVIALT